MNFKFTQRFCNKFCFMCTPYSFTNNQSVQTHYRCTTQSQGWINQKADKTKCIQRKRLSTKVKMKAWAVRNQQEIARAYESLIQALPKMILNTVEAA